MQKELQTYRDQLASNPDDAEALARLESALIRTADWEGLRALYVERARNLDAELAAGIWTGLLDALESHAAEVEEAGLRSDLALFMGRVWEQQLGQPEQAMRRYQLAFKLDPKQISALRAAREIYQEQGNWELVLQLYTLQLQVTPEPASQADLYFEMAEVCSRQLGDDDKTALCVRQALKLVPDHPRAQDYAPLLTSVRADHQSRFDELMAQAEGTRDPRRRARFKLEAVDLWMKEAPDDDRVETLLRDVLAGDPRNDHARILLEQFYESNARWDDLVAFLKGRAEATNRKPDRMAIYLRLAQVSRNQLRDAAGAVEWYRAVLKLDSVESEALNYSVDYYSDREDWLELVAVYEAALRARHRAAGDSAMLIQIAMILWRKVVDLDAAESYFRRIKLNDPRNRLMLEFYAEYYAASEDWKRLLATLAARQGNESTVEAKIELGLEMARVAEDNLGNLEKSIDVWKSILKLRSGHSVARAALRRLFASTRKWNALLEFLKEDQNLTAEDDVDARVSILRKMIEIYRDSLNLEVMVVNTYNQILQIDPTNAEALDALQEKYEASSRWNDLIGVLKRRGDAARAAGDDEAYVALLRQIAGLWLDKFSNPNQAIEYLEGILELRPRDESAIDRLIGIYKHRKDWAALQATWRRQLPMLEGEVRRTRIMEMAEVAARRLGKSDEAIELWREVLDAEPANEKGWEALENLYRKTERWAALAELFETRAAAAAEREDVEAQVGWLKKLGDAHAERLSDEDAAAETWRRVLALVPGDAHAAGYLRELFLRRADWASLEALYGERGDWTGFIRLLGGAGSQAAEVPGKVEIYKRMARICRVNLDDEGAAVECWERILDVDGENLEAARTLAPHYERSEAWDALVAVLEVLLRNEPENAVALMTRLAAVHESRRGDAAQAYRWHAEALQSAPENEEILLEVRRTAELSGRWDELAVLLGVLAEVIDEPEAEIRIRRVLAEACADQLDRRADATRHYERIVELSGDSDEVLDALQALYEKLSQWDELLGVYQRRLERADLPDAQAEILARIGELHETVRDDGPAAREAYERLRELDPGHLEALHGLQRLAEEGQDLPALKDYLETELGLTSEPGAVAALLFRLGRLSEQTGAPTEALERYAKVVVRVPVPEPGAWTRESVC